ncbi:GNAT family N-acetyltransferase [Sphingomonas bacterium]|uniref:GNAT family N-acetyltransferase n=1 Tax=Sphingomonas bacterium TaxID=1895847 RepID=UPI00157705B8|nr:GNAT family N-acetyltransferase [Sphingomonas bacterium]
MFAITERLLLRPGWMEDAPALSRAIGEEAIVRNLSRAPWPYALGDAQTFLASPRDPLRPNFLICRRDDAAIVGGIGLIGASDADEAELGYWIGSAHWGHGYATEAGRAVVAIADASLRIPRLRASHALDNPASGRVLAKLGFRQGALGRIHSIGRGGEMEVRLFSRDRRSVVEQALAA